MRCLTTRDELVMEYWCAHNKNNPKCLGQGNKLTPDLENGSGRGGKGLEYKSKSLCFQLLVSVSHTGF